MSTVLVPITYRRTLTGIEANHMLRLVMDFEGDLHESPDGAYLQWLGGITAGPTPGGGMEYGAAAGYGQELMELLGREIAEYPLVPVRKDANPGKFLILATGRGHPEYFRVIGPIAEETLGLIKGRVLETLGFLLGPTPLYPGPKTTPRVVAVVDTFAETVLAQDLRPLAHHIDPAYFGRMAGYGHALVDRLIRENGVVAAVERAQQRTALLEAKQLVARGLVALGLK